MKKNTTVYYNQSWLYMKLETFLDYLISLSGSNTKQLTQLKDQIKPGICSAVTTLLMPTLWLRSFSSADVIRENTLTDIKRTIEIKSNAKGFDYDAIVKTLGDISILPWTENKIRKYFEQENHTKNNQAQKMLKEILALVRRLHQNQKTLTLNNISQGNTTMLLKHFSSTIYKKELGFKGKYTIGRVKKEFSIAGLFVKANFEKLLNDLNACIKYRPIRVSSHNHATSILKNTETVFQYQDANDSEISHQYKTLSEVSNAVYLQNFKGLAATEPAPIALKIFNFGYPDFKPEAFPEVAILLSKYASKQGHASEQCYYESGLTIAARVGCIESVRFYLNNKKEYNVNLDHKTAARDTKPLFTALCIAAQNGHFEIVELLLQYGANINQSIVNGRSILYQAARFNRLSIAKLLLLSHGNKIRKLKVQKCLALCTAASRGSLDVAKLLIQHKTKTTLYDTSPLWHAAESGKLDILKLLIENDADINRTDKTGCPPISKAAYEGHYNTVAFLIDKGANFNLADNNGLSPIHYAAMGGNETVLELLIKHSSGIDWLDNFGQSPLWHAAKNGHAKTIKLLINYKAEMSRKNKKGESPLWIAAQHGHLNAVKILVHYSTEINVLPAAIVNGNIDVIRLLIGKKDSFSDEKGQTVFHWLAQSKGEIKKIFNLLLNHYRKINHRDKAGATPLWWAAKHGNHELLKILLKQGARYNQENNNKVSPLVIAVRGGHKKTVRLLLRQTPKITIEALQKLTTLAMQQHHFKLVIIFSNRIKYMKKMIKISQLPPEPPSRPIHEILSVDPFADQPLFEEEWPPPGLSFN